MNCGTRVAPEQPSPVAARPATKNHGRSQREGHMPRGDGRILQHPKSGTWFICFYQDGREVRESVAKLLGKPPHAGTEIDAKRALRRRLGAVESGAYGGPARERQTVREVMADYKTHIDLHAKAKKTSYIRIRR